MIHELKIDKTIEYDVVVCGGGMTGYAAAVTASEKGQKTLLIEKGGCLGGVATSGAVTCLLGGMDYENGDFRFVTGGLFEEMYYSLRKDGDCVDIYSIDRYRSPHAWYSGLTESIIFDNDAMKRYLDKTLLNSGSDLLYFSCIIDVKTKNNKIDYVLLSNKDGITAVTGKTFIDCTGDGDVAYMSGCSMTKGREEDELMMPATLIMTLENVDTEALLNYIEENNSPRFREKIKALTAKGEWPFPIEIFISMLLNRPGHHMVNSIRQVGIDGTDAKSLTMGMIEGRADNKKLFDIVKENIKPYKDSVISSMAEVIGIRETRRIRGSYTLTLDDLISGSDFDDIIALSSYCFDVPDPKKPSYQPLDGQQIKKQYAEVPYRCMIPDKIENLIVTGRSISIERIVMGPLRVMGPCIGMGQAAGLAASVCIIDKVNAKDVDINKLKKQLREIGCIIDESEVRKVRKDI